MSSLSRRDFLKLGVFCLLSVAFGRHAPFVSAGRQQSVLYRGSARYPRVALTYDDCNLVTQLQKLEKIYDPYPDMCITFFPVGEALLNNEQKDPGIWRRFYQRGYEFDYHTFPFEHISPDDHALPGLIDGTQPACQLPSRCCP